MNENFVSLQQFHSKRIFFSKNGLCHGIKSLIIISYGGGSKLVCLSLVRDKTDSLYKVKMSNDAR